MTQNHFWEITHLNQTSHWIKTKWMLVSTRQMSLAHALHDYYPAVSCNGKLLKCVTTAKILGVHMDEYLTWPDLKLFPLSVFVFIDSLIVSFSFSFSALQDPSGYSISYQNNLELHLGCRTCWLSYFTLVCLWCGRTASGRCTVTWLPNFLGWIDLLTHRARARARESSSIM